MDQIHDNITTLWHLASKGYRFDKSFWALVKSTYLFSYFKVDICARCDKPGSCYFVFEREGQVIHARFRKIKKINVKDSPEGLQEAVISGLFKESLRICPFGNFYEIPFMVCPSCTNQYAECFPFWFEVHAISFDVFNDEKSIEEFFTFDLLSCLFIQAMILQR